MHHGQVKRSTAAARACPGCARLLVAPGLAERADAALFAAATAIHWLGARCSVGVSGSADDVMRAATCLVALVAHPTDDDQGIVPGGRSPVDKALRS